MLRDNTDVINQKIKDAVAKAVNEIGIVGTANIKANTPVDTGKLRSSYTYKADKNTVAIGSDLEYAPHVEFKPINRGGRPHFKLGLTMSQVEFQSILKKHLGGI